MARFFVRIEMHGADTAEYNELHKRMEKASFTKSPNPFLVFPDASYIGKSEKELTAKEIDSLVQELIKKITNKKASIMVIEFEDASKMSTSHLEAREEKPASQK